MHRAIVVVVSCGPTGALRVTPLFCTCLQNGVSATCWAVRPEEPRSLEEVFMEVAWRRSTASGEGRGSTASGDGEKEHVEREHEEKEHDLGSTGRSSASGAGEKEQGRGSTASGEGRGSTGRRSTTLRARGGAQAQESGRRSTGRRSMGRRSTGRGSTASGDGEREHSLGRRVCCRLWVSSDPLVHRCCGEAPGKTARSLLTSKTLQSGPETLTEQQLHTSCRVRPAHLNTEGLATVFVS